MQSGFILCSGRNVYFMPSEKKNKCKSVTDAFINALCDLKGLCDDFRQRILTDEPTRKELEDRYAKGNYELATTSSGIQYHHFEQSYCIMNFPLTDCEEVILLKEA